MFLYNDLKIISSAPIKEIRAYLNELDGIEISDLVYKCGEIEIEIKETENEAAAILEIPQNIINVRGDRVKAERFLTGFRFRFLSAGG